MRLSRAKVNHLSRLVIEAMVADDRVRISSDQNDIRLEIVRLITEEIERDAMVDELVRTKITSQKRDFPEGSREWEILYRQYYQEEMEKHRPPRE